MGVDITVYLVKKSNGYSNDEDLDYKMLDSTNRSYGTNARVFEKYENSDDPLEQDLLELYRDAFMPIAHMMVSLDAVKKTLENNDINDIFKVHKIARDFWPLFLLYQFEKDEDDGNKVFITMTH